MADAILFVGLHKRIPTATFPTNQTKDRPAGYSPKDRDLNSQLIEKSDFFRDQIRQCRSQAERAANKTDREFWLRLAQRWEELLQRGGAGLEADQKPSFARPISRNKTFAKRFAKWRAA
ncbi:MAG: hypothetical protein WB689_38395 [Xanthobacteraceae bacterium]